MTDIQIQTFSILVQMVDIQIQTFSIQISTSSQHQRYRLMSNNIIPDRSYYSNILFDNVFLKNYLNISIVSSLNQWLFVEKQLPHYDCKRFAIDSLGGLWALGFNFLVGFQYNMADCFCSLGIHQSSISIINLLPLVRFTLPPLLNTLFTKHRDW